MPTPTGAPFLSSRRINTWRAIVFAVLAALLVGKSRWGTTWSSDALILAAIVLVSCATVGRLWCALYISGRKGSSLVKEGPYSMCRHPLYVCNFMGIVGLGAFTGSFAITAVLALAFGLLYPDVIRSEERLMATRFPDYADYARTTPAFIPRPALYQTPAAWSVDVPSYLRNVADSIGFPLLTIVIMAIELAHLNRLLPNLFPLP
jgi:protein-S-isoprenylcysteine O-methyltransferase Ste14